MPELGEIIAPPDVAAEFAATCPFKKEPKTGDPKKPENIEDDDLDDKEGLQENDGGVLGQNLEAKKPGEGTGGVFPPTEFLHKQTPNDSKRGEQRLIHLEGYKDAQEGDFPFTVAAHHLVPGNASLYDEDVKLINYMEDGKSVETAAKKTYKIEGHIGYDVNGSHNGVWLPGNYAIKKAMPKTKKRAAVPGTTPVKGKAWSDLEAAGYEPWQYKYVAGACKAGKGQFHDAHEDPYSATVRKNLMTIVTALNTHLDRDPPCPDCQNNEKVIPPPQRIKMRLYALSQALRGFVQGPPEAWKAPWFTSEKWSQRIFSAGGKIKDDFVKAYNDAKVTSPTTVIMDEDD